MSGTLLFRTTSLHQDHARLVSRVVDVTEGHKIYLLLDISNDLSTRANEQEPPKFTVSRSEKERLIGDILAAKKNSDAGCSILSLDSILLYLLSGPSFKRTRRELLSRRSFSQRPITTFDLPNQTGAVEKPANDII